ncbi:MAG: hypothetical protein ACMVP2_20505 [Imperialibacter sp.]|uniref:hypothetical protein n=1 Tax=Imperialibacter sp. TaxID=2038411 RepID=UPI003A87F1BA
MSGRKRLKMEDGPPTLKASAGEEDRRRKMTEIGEASLSICFVYQGWCDQPNGVGITIDVIHSFHHEWA